MSSSEVDDLFGDGDDEDSLFGGDDDHLFGAPDACEDGQPTPRSATPDAPAGSNVAICLSLPSVPDPRGALSRDHVGLTSGQHTVSTQDPSGNVWGLSIPETVRSETAVDARASMNSAIDNLPLATQPHGNQAGHERQTQSHPSRDPSPSKHGSAADLERMFEEEFAQDRDKQDQSSHVQPLLTAGAPVVFPTSDVGMIMEYNALQDQARRATTTSLGNPPESLGIEIPAADCRWAKAQTRQGIRLPRRIDLDGADVDVLSNYVTLNRGLTDTFHYAKLELPSQTGRHLKRDVKEYLQLSPHGQQMKEKGWLTVEEKRHKLLSGALRLLKDEGWGVKWFGPSSSTGAIRSFVWPADSSMILMRFTGFLYKVADQERKVEERHGRLQRRRRTVNLGTSGMSSTIPIDLTHDDDGVSVHDLTRNTSVCSSRPTSSHTSGNQASESGTAVSNEDVFSPSWRSYLTLPAYRSPAFRNTRPDFYIVEDSASATPKSPGEATQTSDGHDNSACPNAISLDMLAGQIAQLKQSKRLETRTVKYRLTFTDRGDDQNLRPPLVGVLADELIQGNKAVSTLKGAFQKAGAPATIYITGADGSPVEVTRQDEWNEAVHSVWQQHGNDAVVDVGIRV